MYCRFCSVKDWPSADACLKNQAGSLCIGLEPVSFLLIDSEADPLERVSRLGCIKAD